MKTLNKIFIVLSIVIAMFFFVKIFIFGYHGNILNSFFSLLLFSFFFILAIILKEKKHEKAN